MEAITIIIAVTGYALAGLAIIRTRHLQFVVKDAIQTYRYFQKDRMERLARSLTILHDHITKQHPPTMPTPTIPDTRLVTDLLRRYVTETRQLHLFIHWLKEQGIDPAEHGITAPTPEE